VAGKFIKGALVQLKMAAVLPLPNVIIFQFNPETMTHTWSAAAAAAADPREKSSDPLAVDGVPGEQFSFNLLMDTTDMIADGSVVAQGLATATGIGSRIAALEMLQYPVDPSPGGELLGQASLSVGSGGIAGGVSAATASSSNTVVPRLQVPTVLFVWGPARILPVRITSLTITERLYDELLNPTHAEAQIGLKVLTPRELKFVTGVLGTVANAAYSYSQALRQGLAIANLANAAESIIGMLPV
jgi:hypothetical protein